MHYDNAVTKHNVMAIIKTEIFHKYKYIRSTCDLDYSTDKNSLAQMILNRLNIPNDNLIKQLCWRQINYMVARNLNNTRTIKLAAIKLKFDCK